MKRKLSKFPVLISYAYARNSAEAFRSIAANPKIDLMLDSGAFTAHNSGFSIRLSDYCDFIDKHNIAKYFALDVLGDPEKSNHNLKSMIEFGYKPIPVHVFGDSQRRMDELFELSDYVALGGLHVGSSQGHRYLAQKMQWARGRKVHWFAYVREELFHMRPHSCDSSTWLAGVKYGETVLYVGNGQWAVSKGVRGRIKYKDRSLLLRPPARAVVTSLGFSRESIHNKDLWRSGSNSIVESLSTDSWVRYCLDVFKYFGIRLYLVLSPNRSSSTRSLIGAIERWT